MEYVARRITLKQIICVNYSALLRVLGVGWKHPIPRKLILLYFSLKKIVTKAQSITKFIYLFFVYLCVLVSWWHIEIVLLFNRLYIKKWKKKLIRKYW